MTFSSYILAGGLGHRLRSVSGGLPKCLMPIHSTTLLSILIQKMLEQTCERVVLCLGYKSSTVIDYVSERFSDERIVFSVEQRPLGTGGAICLAAKNQKGDLFVVNGDTFLDIDFGEFVEAGTNSARPIHIAAPFVENVSRYGELLFDEFGQIANFKEKGIGASGYINGGHYLIRRSEIENMPAGKFSLELDFLQHNPTACSAFKTDGAFIDIGIPSDYKLADSVVKNTNILNA